MWAQEFPMNETKSVWQSKTMWGGVLQLAALILAQQGIEVTAEEQALVLNEAFALMASLASVSGVVMTVWGRFTATKKVTLVGDASKIAPLIVAGLCLTAGGCKATTPMGSYAQTQEVFISTVIVLKDARELGKISDGDWVQVKAAINRGSDLLDEMKAVAETGNLPATELLRGHVAQVLRQLLVEAAKLERATRNGSPNYRIDYLIGTGGGGPSHPKLQRTHREAIPRLHRQARRAA